MKIIVAHSGASGSIYCVKFLKWLTIKRDVKVSFIASDEGWKILQNEMQMGKPETRKYVSHIYSNSDLSADISSGTSGIDGMVVLPASMNTVAKIAGGIADNLITRCASNMLKLRRKLIVVAREMPLSTIHLENMAKLSAAGADVMFASPPFYHNPKTIDEIVLPVVYYINELLGFESNINFKWRPAPSSVLKSGDSDDE